MNCISGWVSLNMALSFGLTFERVLHSNLAGEEQNTLEICGMHNRYRLNRQKLGLTMTEFKWLALELRDGLGVPLT